MITYLDNAATSYPKPRCVIGEMVRCMGESGGNPGRGSHTMALKASDELYRCREVACRFFSAESTENAVFTLNATHALNCAVFGLIPRGSHVLISDMEHNSVLRPVEYLRRNFGVSYGIFKTEGDIEENIRKLITPKTVAVICNHSSNIINRTLPQKAIGEVCKKHGLLFILDASQSAGSHRISMSEDNISALCFPAHKGLMGPPGCGMVIFAKELLPTPLLYGGSGVNSAESTMPDFLPDRLEAGTLSAPCAAGLRAGIEFVEAMGTENILKKEKALTDILFQRYEKEKKVRIYGKSGGGLFLFTVDGQTAQKTGELLNRQGICVRTGLHCAPLAHKTVGTPKGGAVRLSVGPMSRTDNIYHFISALDKII